MRAATLVVVLKSWKIHLVAHLGTVSMSSHFNICLQEAILIFEAQQELTITLEFLEQTLSHTPDM